MKTAEGRLKHRLQAGSYRKAAAPAGLRTCATPDSFVAMRFTAFLIVSLSLAACATAAEVQRHGYTWETWLADTFFGGYRQESYTQKWDFPAVANTGHGGIPANPKATKFRTPLDLGDALRQFDIDEPFLLIVGYWVQEGERKRFVNVIAPRVEPALWRMLWGDITRADLERLDALIKDRSLDYREARRLAQAMKSSPPFSTARITLNPKIDSRGQRRLQCSLGFDAVFTHLAPDASRHAVASPSLFGTPIPGPFYSPPRSFGESARGPHDATSGNPR